MLVYRDPGFHTELAKLYLLGDYLCDIPFCLAVVDEMVEAVFEQEVCPGYPSITLVWNSTTEGSTLRKVMKELWQMAAIGPALELAKEADYPMEFILDMFNEMAQRFTEITKDGFPKKTRAQLKQSCRKHMSFLKSHMDIGEDEPSSRNDEQEF